MCQSGRLERFVSLARIQHQFYGWHDPRRGYLVSREPPDAPVRPAVAFETPAQALASVKRSRRLAEILWIPPLPKGLMRDADQS